MLRFVVLAVLVASAFAGNYGRQYRNGAFSLGALSYGGLGLSNYAPLAYQASPVVTGAVQSRHSLAFYDVPSTYSAPRPLTIDLPASSSPLKFLLRSKSSDLNLETLHESSPGSYAESRSVDSPHVRVHSVERPIIHKVNELVQPYRQITQKVLPLQENVQQLVSRGVEQPQQQQQLVQLVQPQLQLVQLQAQPQVQLVQLQQQRPLRLVSGYNGY